MFMVNVGKWTTPYMDGSGGIASGMSVAHWPAWTHLIDGNVQFLADMNNEILIGLERSL